MTHLDTKFPTIVFKDFPLIEPSVIKQIMGDENIKLNHIDYYYREKKTDMIILFVRDIASGFLDMHDFNHHKDIWYMDCIQYKLDNETKPIKSGLAWHCENDNYPNLITVLLYLRKDEGVKEGNLRYKNSNNQKCSIEIYSGTTIIMDGKVPHKPQDPYGTGRRDLIIVSFRKM
jgi:hypothetical protein|tara:strand:- start:65 stop:586 length:522 start_codon:yes stop_codon:yes gene_type:complete